MERSVYVSLILALTAASLPGQSSAFEGPALAELRRVAASKAGSPPTEVRIATLSPFRAPLSRLVDGLPDSTVAASYPVFQVVFPDRWIMIDAAVDSALAGGNPRFLRSAFDSVQLALRHSVVNVVTHEHHDHIGGIVRATERAEVRRRTMLTAAQWASLLSRPNHPLIRVDSSEVSDFTIVPDQRVRSVAPGVALVATAGHTSGSQAVFVRLADGSEFLFAGDIAWHGAGIALRRQKPAAMTRDFGGEDTLAIARQLDWLATLVAEGVTVVVSHDGAALDDLLRRGTLQRGLLTTPQRR